MVSIGANKVTPVTSCKKVLLQTFWYILDIDCILWSWFRTHDTNKDGKLSWDEFHHGMFEHLRDEQDTDHLHPADQIEAKKQVQSKEKFAILDKNKDGWVAILQTHFWGPLNFCVDCYWMFLALDLVSCSSQVSFALLNWLLLSLG